MVRGMTTFAEYFKPFQNDYVVIGGLATVMLMGDLGFLTRATKDVDLVVISRDNEAFIKALLQFIDEGRYKTKERTSNPDRHNLFRFFDPDNAEFPEQIELFAIHTEDSKIITDATIIPIETPEYYPYLSAILLDTDYFNLLVEHTNIIDGVHVATPEALIPLKIHAYRNLIPISRSGADKHLKDIIKLTAALSDLPVALSGMPREDFDAFLPILEGLEEDRIKQILHASNITTLSKDDVLETLKQVYTQASTNV